MQAASPWEGNDVISRAIVKGQVYPLIAVEADAQLDPGFVTYLSWTLASCNCQRAVAPSSGK